MSEVEQEATEGAEEAPEGTEGTEEVGEPGDGEEAGEEAGEAESTHADEQAIFDEKEAEKGRKRIDRAVTGLVKTLQEVLADEAQYLQPCPRCVSDFPGMIWSPEVKQVLPDVRAAVMISMGENPDPALRQDPRANICPVCEGWGKVLTGSHVARFTKLDCEECHGRGFIGARAATIPAQEAPVPVGVAVTNGSSDEPQPDTDPWGRVRGEVNYGVLPGYET